MSPTQTELEAEIKKLAEFLREQKKNGKRVAQEISPVFKEVKEGLHHLLDQKKPSLRKKQLNLEILFLKSQLELVKRAIEKKKREAQNLNREEKHAEDKKKGD